MGIEIYFLPVGDGEKSGDAIVLRYGNLHGPKSEQQVVVIDGGYTDDGLDIVELVQSRFGTRSVDVVISTHPDQDHITGLKEVLSRLEVGELWMHRPWQHAREMASLRASGFRSEKLAPKTQASLNQANDLESIALAHGIPIVEPFAGLRSMDGVINVVGPGRDYYQELLGEVNKAQSLLDALTALTKRAVEAVNDKVKETLFDEALTDSGDTKPINNTSVITNIRLDGKSYLLTGDAGAPALHMAADLLEAVGYDGGSHTFVQVPHHGSRRNVGPTILDRLLGPKGAEGDRGTAFVSASKGAEKHPNPKVVNAFIRRGYHVHGTQGSTKRHHHNAPPHSGYSASVPLAFVEYVEADDD